MARKKSEQPAEVPTWLEKLEEIADRYPPGTILEITYTSQPLNDLDQEDDAQRS